MYIQHHVGLRDIKYYSSLKKVKFFFTLRKNALSDKVVNHSIHIFYTLTIYVELRLTLKKIEQSVPSRSVSLWSDVIYVAIEEHKENHGPSPNVFQDNSLFHI